MYRLGLEGFLGLKKRGDWLEVDPRIPRDWPGFRFTYRFGPTTYEFQVQNPDHVDQGVQQVSLNGQALPGKAIHLSQDGGILYGAYRHGLSVSCIPSHASKPFFSTLVSLRPGIDRRYLIEYIEIDENICDIEIDTRQVSSSVEIVFPLSQNNLTSADEYKIYG